MSERTADRRWRKLRQRFIDSIEDHRCSSCGKWLDEHAPPTAANAITVDHIKSYKHFPELWLDINNLTLLCRACNSAKREGYGARKRTYATPTTKYEQKAYPGQSVWLRYDQTHGIYVWNGNYPWSEVNDYYVTFDVDGKIVSAVLATKEQATGTA